MNTLHSFYLKERNKKLKFEYFTNDRTLSSNIIAENVKNIADGHDFIILDIFTRDYLELWTTSAKGHWCRLYNLKISKMQLKQEEIIYMTGGFLGQFFLITETGKVFFLKLKSIPHQPLSPEISQLKFSEKINQIVMKGNTSFAISHGKIWKIDKNKNITLCYSEPSKLKSLKFFSLPGKLPIFIRETSVSGYLFRYWILKHYFPKDIVKQLIFQNVYYS